MYLGLHPRKSPMISNFFLAPSSKFNFFSIIFTISFIKQQKKFFFRKTLYVFKLNFFYRKFVKFNGISTWGGLRGSNPSITEPQSAVLPLHQIRHVHLRIYQKIFINARIIVNKYYFYVKIIVIFVRD